MPDSFHQYFHHLFHTENVSLIKYYMIKNDSELYILPGNSNLKPILINYTEPPLAKNCFDTKAVWLTNNETESLLTYSAQNLTNTFNDQVFSTYLKQYQQIILISLFLIGFLFGLLVFYVLKKCYHNSQHKKTKTCQLPTCNTALESQMYRISIFDMDSIYQQEETNITNINPIQNNKTIIASEEYDYLPTDPRKYSPRVTV